MKTDETQRGGHTDTREPAFPRLRIPVTTGFFLLVVVLAVLVPPFGATAQKRVRNGSHPSGVRERLSKEDSETVEQAIGLVCSERVRDPKGSAPIDDMQKRPSMPLQAPEVIHGSERAQRLLPVAKSLAVDSLRKLSVAYKVDRSRNYSLRFNRAIARIQAVIRIKADIDARDNASVYMKSPRTITFGTIFLAGLPSDEGMVSVLAHELVHIADGDTDALRSLFRAIGERASNLTGMRIREQRAEELSCDLVGEMAAQSFISDAPNYEPLPRRLARSVEHNCVDEDDSDEDHLSPRNTLRALLALDATLRREIVYGK
jgi:hypothetical protein